MLSSKCCQMHSVGCICCFDQLLNLADTDIIVAVSSVQRCCSNLQLNPADGQGGLSLSTVCLLNCWLCVVTLVNLPHVPQYCVTIHWPTSWLATRGYTSFTLGFETRQEAAQWHTHVQQHVSSMRLRSGTASKAEPSASASACHSSKPSYDDRAMQWSSGGTTITRKPSQVGAEAAAAVSPSCAASLMRYGICWCPYQ